jgi:hypothetical protein
MAMPGAVAPTVPPVVVPPPSTTLAANTLSTSPFLQSTIVALNGPTAVVTSSGGVGINAAGSGTAGTGSTSTGSMSSTATGASGNSSSSTTATAGGASGTGSSGANPTGISPVALAPLGTLVGGISLDAIVPRSDQLVFIEGPAPTPTALDCP